jgi:tungstate transport system permease protein
VDFLLDGFTEAWRLVTSGDAEVLHAVFVTLLCTLSAVTIAALVAFPYGAWLGRHRREGQGFQVFLMRVGMFTPTVVVGLIVYGVLSRRGILGSLDLLYTQGAIVAGEFLLAFPLLVTLVHGGVAALDRRVAETARTLGAGRMRTLWAVLGEVRVALVAAYLAGLARCLSELGVALTVGGNIRMQTRTLSSTITLELRKGEFGTALASGIILLILAVGAALLTHRLSRETRR